VHDAAHDLQFELAARLRDEVNELEKEVTPTSVRVSPSGW
jgi:excinuclease UvrABC helicase subunit UvrB